MVVKDDIKSKLIEGHIFFLPMDGKEEDSEIIKKRERVAKVN